MKNNWYVQGISEILSSDIIADQNKGNVPSVQTNSKYALAMCTFYSSGVIYVGGFGLGDTSANTYTAELRGYYY